MKVKTYLIKPAGNGKVVVVLRVDDLDAVGTVTGPDLAAISTEVGRAPGPEFDTLAAARDFIESKCVEDGESAARAHLHALMAVDQHILEDYDLEDWQKDAYFRLNNAYRPDGQGYVG